MNTNRIHRFPLNAISRRGLAGLLVIASAVAGVPGRTIADDRFWIGTANGDWFDQTKWSTTMPPQLGSSPASVPGTGDHARFESGGGSYDVTFIDDVDLTRLSVASDVVTFDLQSHSLIATQTVHLGTVFNDIGSLTLREGFLVSPVVFVAMNGGDGRLTVESDAALTVNGSLSTIGLPFAVGGAPSLAVGGQGQLSVLGTLHVLDTDSYLGSHFVANGSATVDGGSWITDYTLNLGHDGGSGHLLIEGGGAVSSGGDMVIGESGNEALAETGSGNVQISHGTLNTGGNALVAVAERTFGEVDLAGLGAEWNVIGSLTVSGASSANLHVRDEANLHVHGGNTFISTESVPTAEGLLNVTTFGHLANDGNLYVGGSDLAAGGPGHLLVQSDGTATIGGLLKVWNTGTLTINGGVVTTNNLIIEPGATVDFATGELNVNAGLLTFPDNLLFGGLDILNRPVLRLLNGTSASTTDFFLGGLPGTFAEFEVVDSTLTISNELAVGGDAVEAQGTGRLSVRSGGSASAGGLVRVWETGRISLNGGELLGVDALIDGGVIEITDSASSFQIDAEGHFAIGIPGVHIGLAPTQSSLRIKAGGRVDAPASVFNVGSDQSSRGSVRLDDRGSIMTVGDAAIGALGLGTLNVQSSAHVHVVGDLQTAAGSNADGSVIMGGAGTLTVDGETTIARRGTSLLWISNGGRLHSRGNTKIGSEIGVGGPSEGLVTIEQGGAEWRSDGSIFVGGDANGAQGRGQIIVGDGGALTNEETMRVWPTGSLVMDGGLLHTGALIMEPGANLSLNGGSVVVDGGQFRAPVDVITLDGMDPVDPVALSIVNGGDAEIALSWNIGAVPASFGATTVSGVSADGVPSTLRSAGTGDASDIVVGVKGTGELRVLDGGLVEAGDDVFIAFQGDAVGTVEVAGFLLGHRSTVRAVRAGIDASITVGGRDSVTGGAAELEVRDGGLMETSGNMFVARTPQSTGSVAAYGRYGRTGEINVDGSLFLAGSNEASGGQGQMQVGAGGLVDVANELKVWPEGSIQLDGGTLRTNHLDLSEAAPDALIFASGRLEADRITGSVDNLGGTLARGDIVGGMTLEGHYAQAAAATLEVELVELNIAGVADSLNVSGTATLAGTLSVVMDSEFRPAVGSRFTVMTFASRTGTFGSVVANGLVLFDIEYHDDRVELVITDSPVGPGDLDENGAVDLVDYALMHGCMTGPDHNDPLAFPCGTPDVNRDKRIDLYDFSLWQNTLGFRGLPGVARWTALTGGNWKDNPNWRNAAMPSPSDQVFIDVPDAEVTVTRDNTLSNDGPFESLLSNEKLRLEFNKLSVTGSFQMNNTLEMACGTLTDSTVDLDATSVISVVRHLCNSAVERVTINGDLDIVTDGAPLISRNGPLTINGNVRIGGFTGSAATGLYFFGPDKVLHGNATIAFTRNPSTSGVTQSDHGTLHLTSGITIRGAEGRVGRLDQPLIHDGVIDSDTSGEISVSGAGWVNNGIARVRGVGSELALLGSWTNTGSIEAINGGTLVLGSSGERFQNLGSLTADDSTVHLRGEFEIGDLGAFDFQDSQVVLGGTLFNEVGLILDADQFNWKLGRGTVLGGVISSADGTALEMVPITCCGTATLDGVTLNIDMRMTDGALFLRIRNGLTLNGALRINGHTTSVRLFTSNKHIIGIGRIEFLSTSTSNALVQGDGGTLRIGPGITVQGSNAILGTNAVQGQAATLTNDGTIHANRSGFFQVSGVDWVNNGTIRASVGTLRLNDNWTNHGALHAAGGTLTVAGSWTNHGIVRLGSGPAVQSNADFDQAPTGVILVEVGSTAEGGYGRMVVTGTATLSGVLRVEFLDTITPAPGQAFTVLEYGGRVGEFEAIESSGLGSSLRIEPTYGATSLVLTVVPN